jgi:hypothetical protein
LKSRIRDPYVRFRGRTGLAPLLPDLDAVEHNAEMDW